jgi:hypothetical protein
MSSPWCNYVTCFSLIGIQNSDKSGIETKMDGENPPVFLLLCSTLAAELGACIHLRAAVRAELFGRQRLAALGTELPAGRLRPTVGTGSHDRLLELVGRDIINLGSL